MPPLNRETVYHDDFCEELPTNWRGLPQQKIVSHDEIFMHPTPKRAQPSHARRRKSVRFHTFSLQYPTMNIDDFTTDEIEDTWYTTDDFCRFSRDISRTLFFMMNEPNLIDDIAFTSRGAECRLEHVTQRRRRVRSQARELVFQAQKETASLADTRNDDGIAYGYSQFSQAIAYEAIAKASLDQRDAHNFRCEDYRRFWENYYMNFSSRS